MQQIYIFYIIGLIQKFCVSPPVLTYSFHAISHFELDFKGEKSKLYITAVHNIFKISNLLDTSPYHSQ